MPQSQKTAINKRPPNAQKGEFKSGDKAVENGRKGGIASGEAKRRKKNLAELAKTFSELQVVDDKAKKALAKLGISAEDATQGMVMVASMFNAASKGKVAAAKLIGEWMEAGAVLQDDSGSDPLSAAFEALEGETDED
jgi:hypothetical protein